MNPPFQTSDSELLQRYEKEGSEAAFRELVQRYQSMVLGTAFRRSGNAELAREVAQEVFAALARKANYLIGRPSIGGWLHQAAIYQSARTLQSEVRRHARDERYSQEIPAVAPPEIPAGERPEQLAIVDEALDVLSSADREVLVLHYFQDLSYPEMAKVLGVNEPAVRQRVSRALDRLGRRLRERGVKGNVVLLLLSAVAIQSTVAAPAGLATAALATAAAGGGYSAYLLLTALLSQGVTKTAAVFLALAGVASLLYEAALPESTPGEAPLSAGSPNQSALYASLPESPVSGAIVAPLAATSPGSQESDKISAQSQNMAARALPGGGLRGTHSPIAATIRGAAPTNSAGIAKPSQASLPRVAPAARPAPVKPAATQRPDTTRPAEAAAPGSSAGDSSGSPVPSPSAPDFQFPGVLGEIAEVGGLAAVIDELRRVELIPREAATLYGELLQDVLALEPLQRTRVEEFLEDHYERMKSEGIAGVKSPDIDVGEWKILRETSVSEAVEGVKDVLADVAPDTKVITDILTLGEKQDSAPDSSSDSSIIKPVIEPVVEVVDSAVGSEVRKLTAPLKLPLGR